MCIRDRWVAHEQSQGAKAALADANALCPVEIENSTDQMLDTRYSVVGMDFDIGLLPMGQSVQFSVQCQAGRLQAMAVSRAASLDEGQTRFAKSVRLDPVRGTRLAFTMADRVH